LLCNSASVAISTFVWSQRRTPVARHFAILMASLFFMAFSLAVQRYAPIHTGGSYYRYSVVALLAMIVGSGVLVGAVPFFCHSLVGQTVAPRRRILYVALGAAFVLLALALFLRPGSRPILIVLNVTLFGMISGGIAFLIARYRHIGDRRLRVSIRVALLAAGAFVPIVLLDAMLFRLPLPPEIVALEGTSVPLMFVVMNLLAIQFSAAYLNEVPYYENGRVSSTFRSRYDLSPREAEIISMHMEGKTNREIAERVEIPAGTVEDHLYGICRKTAVRSPVELVNLILEHRGRRS
jgi:DNA-binding CsgD family transcriptional regulator